MAVFADEPHPSFDITGSIDTSLAETRIALCICGSVACIRSPDIARALMRRGADVVPVMSDAATNLIHPDLMHWATGNLPILKLTGAIEHVALAGNVDRPVDFIIVAPATANTIGKIANGIDDTPVTTVVTTALGQNVPVMVVPAMHEPMYRHPIVLENLKRLEQIGIELIMPTISEGKAKIAETGHIIDAVKKAAHRDLPTNILAGKHVLITAGRTVEYLDPIRCITNNSTGKMGCAIAEAALQAGADVTVVFGKGTVVPPTAARVVYVDDADQMRRAVYEELARTPTDVCIAAAAVGDWKPKNPSSEKITTHGTSSIHVELVPTAKIIDEVKSRSPGTFLVAFRALSGLTEDELIENAYQRLIKAKADLIAVNDTSKPHAGFEVDTNELFVIDTARTIQHLPTMSKTDIGVELIKSIASKIPG
jgi:phosphopantothenoylcysteine decarboxylase / phosphopantothenate---cysteine ligase